jgi:hypothetical protein
MILGLSGICSLKKKTAPEIKPPLYKVVSATIDACEKYDFPIDWALPVFFTESGFNPNNITYEKAVKEDSLGSGSILLSTAKDLDSNIKRSDLFDPEKNADLCVKHLSILYKKNCGDMEATLREYNGGNNWRKKKNKGYYQLVKKNRSLILKQEALSENTIFYNYYYAICLELMSRDRLD